jgi:hypothetical protein
MFEEPPRGFLCGEDGYVVFLSGIQFKGVKCMTSKSVEQFLPPVLDEFVHASSAALGGVDLVCD